MTTIQTQREQGSAVSERTGGMSLVLVLTLLLISGFGPSAVVAQVASPAQTGDYQPQKTVVDYMSAADAGEVAFDYAANDLRVQIWVDKDQADVYRKGEELEVGFETNMDAYAVVYRIDTEGRVAVLWPRSRLENGFVFGGHDYQLPVSGARRLTVSQYEGEGLVQAVISRYPFDLRALEIDFHHEPSDVRHDFRVAGDPFLAMNEVNFAVTGLKDSADFVVTNHAGYYVHQTVDHPRYLCSQCHVEEEVAYDPYQDSCTLTIRHDYTWYNNWYDRYGYYPVYGNPVYVYVDPWSYSPWVNYWYRPAYVCAPWYGWGWGWGASYNWGYSPYYRGDCWTWYDNGNRRYRPLYRDDYGDRGVARKVREYAGGSQMVRDAALGARERDAMSSRTRLDTGRAEAGAGTVRQRGGEVAYRGEGPAVRERIRYDERTGGDRSQAGLRIRDNTRLTGDVRTGSESGSVRRRHTAAGDGQPADLAPVRRTRVGDDEWRSTTRGGGTSGSSTVGNSRSGGDRAPTGNVRERAGAAGERGSGESKAVQPRQRSQRVWNAGSGQGETSRGTSRTRSSGVENRRRDDSPAQRDRGAVSPRKDESPRREDSGNRSSGRSERSSGSVQKNQDSGGRSGGSTGDSSGRSSGSSGGSRGTSKSETRDSGGRGNSSRR